MVHDCVVISDDCPLPTKFFQDLQQPGFEPSFGIEWPHRRRICQIADMHNRLDESAVRREIAKRGNRLFHRRALEEAIENESVLPVEDIFARHVLPLHVYREEVWCHVLREAFGIAMGPSAFLIR